MKCSINDTLLLRNRIVVFYINPILAHDYKAISGLADLHVTPQYGGASGYFLTITTWLANCVSNQFAI